jgi:hypothetical protein
MLFLCVAFGVAMIANTQIAGDGSWYWYGTLFNSGRRIYADMHLALQPWFVLETAWFLSLLGKGWLIGKLPAVLHLVLYCWGLLLVLRFSKLEDGQKAILLGGAFFVSICSIAYRFDDYHVVAESFEIYSLAVLLTLEKATSRSREFILAAGLGVLCGLTVVTRLNDGAALLLGVAISTVRLAPSRRWWCLFILCIASALTILAVVRSTGDSFTDYASTSIIRAAGAKGGVSHVLLDPILLLKNTLQWLKRRTIIYYLLVVAAAWALLVLPWLRKPRRSELPKLVVGLVLVLAPLHHYYRQFFYSYVIEGVGAVGVYVLYALGIFAFVRLLLWLFGDRSFWNEREILLIIPLGQLVAMSMSTGGFHYGVYGPEAMLILLLPVAFPFRVPGSIKAVSVAYVALLIVYGAVVKFQKPYDWHGYQSAQMFRGRQIYRHPVYGSMIIEDSVLNFIRPVCEKMSGEKEPSLLGIPNPYGDYFCAIPPWHNNVQTNYDTSTQATVDRIMNELENAPPEFVFYQKEVVSLADNERVFNGGRPLPHRFLGELIESKLEQGAWHAVYTSDFEASYDKQSKWMLIRTAP